jgi:type IV pilus assembly protein PilQ
MRSWTRNFGLFFLAVVAVYSGWRGNYALADSAVPTTQNATGQVSVSDSGAVEIHVKNANLLDVLRLLSQQSQKNIVASKEVTGTVTADLYNVTIHEALDAILKANGDAFQEKGNFINVYTDKEVQDMDKTARAVQTEIFHVYYVPVSDVTAMIKPALSSDGQVAATKDAAKGIDSGSDAGGSGGGSSSSSGGGDTGGNSYAGNDLLVITDYPENLAKVHVLLKEIDKRPQQVLIEATILAATLSDNNAMGINFSFLGGVDFNTLLGTGTSLSGALSSSVLNTVSGSGSTTTGNIGPVLNKGYNGFTTGGFDTQVPAGGLQVGIVHNNLGAFISALESVSNTTILANPKVLALDKQSAQVHVGSSFGYQTTTVTQSSSTQTVQFFDTGTTMSFRPYVGSDGFIRMEIHPEDSSGGLNGSNLPFKNTTEVTSNVMVHDGSTIVIGGLFREQSETSRGQVPGFGNIPFLGALLRNQADTTTRQEIIILLTPHIIKDDSAYAGLSEAEMKAAEQYRVGTRKGMMFFGRERLAETAYENAVAALNQPVPDRKLALWHLNVATNLNPTFIEAIQLKEKVSGHQITDVDNSSIRSFVARAIIADKTDADAKK